MKHAKRHARKHARKVRGSHVAQRKRHAFREATLAAASHDQIEWFLAGNPYDLAPWERDDEEDIYALATDWDDTRSAQENFEARRARWGHSPGDGTALLALSQLLEERGPTRAGASAFTPQASATLVDRLADWASTLQHDPLSALMQHQSDPAEQEALRRLKVKVIGHRPAAWSMEDLLPRQENWCHGVLLAALTYPFWVRPLSTWPGGSMRSMVEHLLVLHPTPEVLYQWLLTESVYLNGPLAWFITRAQGGSVAELARRLGWPVSPPLVAAVERVPPQEVQTLLVRAEVAWAGGNEVDLARVLAHHRLRPSLDAGAPLEFFRATLRWLMRQRDHLSDGEARNVLGWAIHAHDESRRMPEGPAFSWKGRTARSALAAAHAYRQRLAMAWAPVHAVWPAQGWEWEARPTPEDRWQVIELTSTQQLCNEGAAQLHCVGGYSTRCVSGESAIFQLLLNGKRRLTMEVRPCTKHIVQVRGPRNSLAKGNDAQQVLQWAISMGLAWREFAA